MIPRYVGPFEDTGLVQHWLTMLLTNDDISYWLLRVWIQSKVLRGAFLSNVQLHWF